MNSVVAAEIEGCRIEAPVKLGGRNVLVGVDVTEPLELPAGAGASAAVRCWSGLRLSAEEIALLSDQDEFHARRWLEARTTRLGSTMSERGR